MIEMIETGSPDMLEVRATGKLTGKDYEQVLEPAIEAALSESDEIRALVVFDEKFEGYDLSGLWADSRIGLSHWRGFDRLAVATDVGWIATAMRAFAPIAPYPVRVFALKDVDAARLWLRESLGSVHLRDLGGPCVEVQLLGKPDKAAFARAEGDLDALIRDKEGFRLLLDLREFEGWHGLSGAWAHFSLIREHAALVEKLAMVGNSKWQKLAMRVASHFLNARVRFFEASEADAAAVWLAQG